ncbi:P-loop containing nucleoside triphosphate hydrolase protein [Phlyctochytrium arcticum]|nr:P-loop containing nucleoside triphosphate hydrolase protein [Phlyctochytrium arcticum]
MLSSPGAAAAAKVVFVGDEGVGKTSLIAAYLGLPFTDQHYPTLCETYESSDNALELCDTAGAQELDRLRPLSYDGADLFVIVFSMNSPFSLENVVEKWQPEVKYFSSSSKLLVVGCQDDLSADQVDVNLAVQISQEIGAVNFYQCSAKSGKNIDLVFESIRECLGLSSAAVGQPTVQAHPDLVHRMRRYSSKSTIATYISKAEDEAGVPFSKLLPHMASRSSLRTIPFDPLMTRSPALSVEEEPAMALTPKSVCGSDAAPSPEEDNTVTRRDSAATEEEAVVVPKMTSVEPESVITTPTNTQPPSISSFSTTQSGKPANPPASPMTETNSIALRTFGSPAVTQPKTATCGCVIL